MREQVGIFLALALCLLMIMTVLPTARSDDVTPASQTFITEDAEEATYDEWDAHWERWDANDDNVSGQDWWCRQMHEVHSGQRAVFCARNGINSHYLDSTGHQPWNVNLTSLPESASQSSYVLRYDTNQDAIMRRPITGAQYYRTITVTFWFYSDTGASDAKQPGTNASVGYDFLNVIYYTGMGEEKVKRVAWTDSESQATSRTWTQVSIAIPNNATMVGFEFVSGTVPPAGGDASDTFSTSDIRTVPSGSAGMREGVFLDDISVVGTDPAPDFPLVTSVDNLPAYETGLSFPVSIVDNGPKVGMRYANLYYRPAGEVDWTKYTTSDNPAGEFSSGSTVFVAPEDGKYEFLSVGVDQNGTVEAMRTGADESTIVDTTAPVSNITVNGMVVDGHHTGAASFTISSQDRTSGVDAVTYRVDGGGWEPYSTSVGLATSGNHVVDYYATDKAGNIEGTRSESILIVDGSSGIVFDSKDDAFPDGNVTVHFTVVSLTSITKLEYALDGGSFTEASTSSTSFSFTGLSDGEHSLSVRAVDMNGSTLQGKLEFTVGETTANRGGTVGSLDQSMILIGLGVAAAVALVGVTWHLRKRKD
ncbi:MAG: Ig-like domain-containing protein [Methanomassiliicoccus sp.]|nr:Ig-like domain-containing protein [Methanomassiliicoccus sp.]